MLRRLLETRNRLMRAMQGKTVGTVGGGAIGYETLKRLKVGNLHTGLTQYGLAQYLHSAHISCMQSAPTRHSACWRV